MSLPGKCRGSTSGLTFDSSPASLRDSEEASWLEPCSFKAPAHSGAQLIRFCTAGAQMLIQPEPNPCIRSEGRQLGPPHATGSLYLQDCSLPTRRSVNREPCVATAAERVRVRPDFHCGHLLPFPGSQGKAGRQTCCHSPSVLDSACGT